MMNRAGVLTDTNRLQIERSQTPVSVYYGRQCWATVSGFAAFSPSVLAVAYRSR